MHFAKLTERELDSANAQKLLPGGCDQQGREPTREWVPMDFRPGWYIQAAEAATELGQKEEERWTKAQLALSARDRVGCVAAAGCRSSVACCADLVNGPRFLPRGWMQTGPAHQSCL